MLLAFRPKGRRLLISFQKEASFSLFNPTRRAQHALANGRLYDVIVIGGGLVGSAVVAALSSNRWTENLKVVVLDRQAPPQESAALAEVPGLRVSTITPSSARFLQEVTDWQDTAPPRSTAFSSMQVWDCGGNGFVQYHASDVGQEVIGYVAENSVIHTAFLRQLSKPGKPPIFQYPAIVEALHLPPYANAKGKSGLGMPLAEVILTDSSRLKARLVIGADGARSQVRGLAELRTIGWPYHQRGLVATVRTKPTNSTAMQRFLEAGPLALLPVRGGYSNIVWSTTPQHADYLAALSPSDFAAEANLALTGGSRPTSSFSGPPVEAPPEVLEWVGEAPKSFPLHLSHAGRYVRPRLALVGDAAHSIHPLAGQGVNLGFEDVKALTNALAHATECGRDVGELALLEEMYEKPRQRANISMMAALDGLSRLYKPQGGLLAKFRSAGLGFINSSPLAKQQIMKYAMGV